MASNYRQNIATFFFACLAAMKLEATPNTTSDGAKFFFARVNRALKCCIQKLHGNLIIKDLVKKNKKKTCIFLKVNRFTMLQGGCWGREEGGLFPFTQIYC